MITTFKGQYSFLSNFFKLTYPIPWYSINYPTSEHFFQAMKTLNYDERVRIATCSTTGEAKRIGRKITLRKDWDSVKDVAMRTGLTLKFSLNTEIADKLLNTGNQTLVEGNYWHDNYWGNCLCPKCVNIPGKNRLGVILMYIRNILKHIG